MQVGGIVRFRGRDWVMCPSEDSAVYCLRPLTGLTEEVVEVHKGLVNLLQQRFPEEGVRPSVFPLPEPGDISDAAGAHLLWQSARLMLREGAAPLRSLGRISIRPRLYQLVPLLMALRLDPVRLFIADDVGVGKTIEALLVVRELWDRGEVRRVAVLCPPYLCDQWERELREKFHLDPVVIRSSTISRLERQTPPGQSVYQYYPVQVISIDWVKSDRNKHQFLQFCPEMLIVDEVHGAAEASGRSSGQQQRHQLLQEIAKDPDRHLLLLTATPHSGLDEAFGSLLGLLRPEFRHWEPGQLTENQREELACHFIQRTRQDILQSWSEQQSCFPQRVSVDESYGLSKAYQKLFTETWQFCSEMVRTGQRLEQRRRRLRHWAALALLRCVMSSPAAAVVALEKRSDSSVVDKGSASANGPSEAAQQADGLSDADLDVSDYRPYIFESASDLSEDEAPRSPIEAVEDQLTPADRRRLRELAELARTISNQPMDPQPPQPMDAKLSACVQVIGRLVSEGHHPIIWCRYVATAEYVGQHLAQALGQHVQVVVLTGRLSDQERRMKLAELDPDRPRVLVATDCLSEGINLQEQFTAVLHYDLPWNPNRLEQREGRVDRFGQTASKVKVVRFYGWNNPVDGVVLDVLFKKAEEIYRTLGTRVPVPEESETVIEALLNALFLRSQQPYRQRSLFDEYEEIRAFHRQWDQRAERERVNRTRFAQRAIKLEEVQREMEAVDQVLGDPEAVRMFIEEAAKQIELPIRPDPRNPEVYLVNVSAEAVRSLPEMVKEELPESKDGRWRISFISPTPEGAEYVGRNHRFVAALARYLLEDALSRPGKAEASRAGVIRTRAVDRLTALLLLRVRYLIQIPEKESAGGSQGAAQTAGSGPSPLLSEEVLVMGFRPLSQEADPWLSDQEALRLLAQAKEPSGNVPMEEKKELLLQVLDCLGATQWTTTQPVWGRSHPVQQAIRQRIEQRAEELLQSHKRIRKAIKLRVRELAVQPQLPPDLLGLLVLQPEVGR